MQASKLWKTAKMMDALKQEGNDAFKAGNMPQAIDAYTRAMAIEPRAAAFNSQVPSPNPVPNCNLLKHFFCSACLQPSSRAHEDWLVQQRARRLRRSAADGPRIHKGEQQGFRVSSCELTCAKAISRRAECLRMLERFDEAAGGCRRRRLSCFY